MKLSCGDELNGLLGWEWETRGEGLWGTEIRTSECRAGRERGISGGEREWKGKRIALPGEWRGEQKLSEIITGWPRVNQGDAAAGKRQTFSTSRRSIATVTQCSFAPHYLFSDQRVLKQVAEERGQRADWRDVDGCWRGRDEEPDGEVWLRGRVKRGRAW